MSAVRRAAFVVSAALVAVLPGAASGPAAAAPESGRLSGVVIDEQSRAVPSAVVSLMPAGSGIAAAQVTADGGGRYSATVAPGDYDIRVTGHVGNQYWAARVNDVDVDDDAGLDVAMSRSFRFRGKVLDAAGTPLAGVHINLNGSGAMQATGSDGAFDVDVRPGTYPLVLTKSDNTAQIYATLPDFVVDADVTADLTLPLRRHRVTVTGPTGNPLSSTSVSVRGGYRCAPDCQSRFDMLPGRPAQASMSSSGYTDAEGRVVLDLLPVDAMEVAVMPSLQSPSSMWEEVSPLATPAPAEISAAVLPTALFRGKVTAPTGTADSPPSMRLTNSSVRTMGYQVDYDGTFAVQQPPGRYQLEVIGRSNNGDSSDFGMGFVSDFELPASGRVQDFVIPGEPFPVRVLDSDGSPVAGATVSVSTGQYANGGIPVDLAPGIRGGATNSSSRKSGADGLVQAIVIPGATTASFYVSPPSGALLGAFYDQQLAITPAGVTVRLPRLGRLSGVVRDAGGAPVPGVAVGLSQVPTSTMGTSTAADGSYSAPAGAGRAQVTFNRYYPWDTPATPALPNGTWVAGLEADVSGDTVLDVALPPARPVEVRVTGTNGQPKGGRISLSGGYATGVSLGGGRTGSLSISSQQVVGDGRYDAKVFTAGMYSVYWQPSSTNSSGSMTVNGAILRPGSRLAVAAAVVAPGTPPVTSSTTTTTTVPGGPTVTTGPVGATTTTTVAGALVGAAKAASGYWMLGRDGRVYSFGDAAAHGDLATSEAADLEPTPSGKGYWVIDDAGRVAVKGDAVHFGDVDRAGLALGELATSLSATPKGDGYWVFTSRGRALAFGGAIHYGDMADATLNGPVLDSVPTPSGRGYYMVASDGGIFAFGDARFAGSMGGRRLNAPVQSLVPDADGVGYWLVASDGGIFAFDASFRGSMGGVPLNRPVTGMVRFGDGYLMVGEDGGIFNFSTRPFAGSLGHHPPAHPIVSVAALPE